jgi:hypothetical protein
MKKEDLKGNVLKKLLGAEKVHYRWHNKNNSGGNFGINILWLAGRHWEITGDYDLNGNTKYLKFGPIYWGRTPIQPASLEELITIIQKEITKDKGAN